MSYVLIIYFYAGMFAKGDSIGIATQEFANKARCEAAGTAAAKFVSGTAKNVEWVCVEK